MSLALNVQVELTSIDCGQCGGTYAISEKFRKQRHDKGGGWHCPYCQTSWGFFGETQAEKAQRLLREEQDRHSRTISRLNDAEKKLTQHQKRIKAGTCPCCKRTFQQLARHMKAKHPSYAK